MYPVEKTYHSMKGYILLEGGAEFGGLMAAPDRRALELAGDSEAEVNIIPAAAAPDHNDRRAGETGARWFRQLGAARVAVVPLTDLTSANQPEVAAALRESGLIYLLGGFPRHLAESLAGSLSWQAMVTAYEAGAVLGGSSAGAMVLGQHYFDPYTNTIAVGLNLVPRTCVVPHHNQFGKGWIARLADQLPEIWLVGLDEQTGLLDDGPGHTWNVYGKGSVTLYRGGQVRAYRPGEPFSL
jgi:cyanophycinase